jgi:hypothetical protein
MNPNHNGGKPSADAAALIEKIKNPDETVHYDAWQKAGPEGASAVAPLADLITSDDKGVGKAARGALQNIAYYSARPGSRGDAHAVSSELLKVAQSSRPYAVRALALHLLGFTADSRMARDIGKLLEDATVREDARMCVERIPGSGSLAVLKHFETTAPADFKPNVEQSLHNRALTPKSVGTEPAR